jgi:branched-chain amino acid transport system ATP-binding protein
MTNVLEAQSINRSFGGIHAVVDVNLCLVTGEIRAVIGPNGAGKTTLVGLLAGSLKPDSGEICLAQQNVTALSVHERVKLGLARTFQITSLFPALSVFENIAIAVQGYQGHSFRFWHPANRKTALIDRACELAQEMGLTQDIDTRAEALSHGKHRLLELAMALAANPSVLLLDEPAAGLGVEETQNLISMLERIKADAAILLVEHDMDVVFSVANEITVMVDGRIIATGSPDDIRNNQQAQQAYLGEPGLGDA